LLALRLLVLILLLVIPLPINIGLAYEGEFFWDEVLDVHGSVMLLIETETGRIVKANQAASAFYGYSLEELVGMGIDEINQLPPDQIERERQDAAAQERNYFIFPHRLKDGTVRTVEVYSYPVDPEGRYLFSIIHDITARIEAETTLVDYNQRLKRAEDISGIGHWEFHLTENRVVASEGAKRIYGLGDEEWTITAVQTIPLPQYREMLDLALANLIEKGEPYDVEFRIRRPSDGAIVDIRSIAEYDPEREVVFGTVMDVTQYHQLVRVAETQRNEIIVVIALLLLVSIGGIVILARHLRLRKRSEEQLAQSLDALRERERQLANLMNNLPGMAYRCRNDPHWTMLFVSDGVKELLGYEPEDLIGNSRVAYNDLILPSYHTQIWNAWQEVLKDKRTLTLEYEVRTASGEIKWVWEQVNGVYDENGELRFLEGLIMDITELKKTEAALRRREQDLEVTLQSIGDAVITTDTHGRITRMNPIAERLTGWSSEEAQGRPLNDVFRIISTITRQVHPDPVSQVLRTGRVVGLANHTSLIARDGIEYQIADSAAPIVDLDGRILGVVLVFHDVTEIYQQRAALAQQERQFRELFQNSISAISVFRLVYEAGNPEDCVFLRVNAAFEKYTGLRPDDVIGRRVTEILPDFRETGLLGISDEVLRTGKPRTIEMYFASLQRYYYVSLYSTSDDQLAVIFDDITDRKLAEEELRRSTQLLEDAQRLGRLGGWEWDVKEERLLWTKETYRIHGLDPENVSLSSRELMEISFRCFAEPERTIIEGAFLRCQMTGTPYDLELPMTTVDGDPRWVRVVAYAVFDHEGKVAKVLGNMVDITERKQAEVELQNSEQRFRKLVELAPDAIFVEIDGKFTYLNDAALSLFGVTRPEELIGKPVLDRIAPEYKETVAQRLHKLNVERERVPRNEEVFLQVDGTRVDVEVAAVPIQFQAEWGALVYARDITQRKQAEEQLRYLTFHDPVTGLYNRTFLEQKLKELDTEASLPLGVLMADVNGLKVINDSLGHQQGDVLLKRVGQILQEACHPTDTIGRWGGDEFVALLPHTTEARLREICTRIEQACEEEGFVPFYISLAVGYAVKEREEESIDEVIKAAEDAMYQRKMNKALSNKSALVTSLQRALGEKSHETEHHARRLQQMAVALGERWGLSGAQLDEVSLLALLHDIGKVAISEEILMKEGKLTMEEREIIRRHPEIGYRIATASPDLAVVAEGILSHHERWDGRGYPRGLKGEDIPLSARIVAIVDAFEAMTSGRPYCEKMSTEEALQEIMACADSQFDPKLAKVFVEMIRDWEQSSAESAASDDHEGQGM